jgi:tetratricopeptide (TPR) repeat protein
MIRRPDIITSVLLLVLAVVAGGAELPALSEEIRAWGRASVDLVFQGRFREAEAEAKRIIRRYPEHPSGYFFCAAVLDAEMERRQQDREENQFYHYCDQAISKGERLIERQPDDPWAKFFVAAANGAKGAHESRYERWITAFRHGWQGVALFKQIKRTNPEIKDILYGIGLYDYWRSAMTRVMWWMPGVEDRREEAIAMLYEATEEGLFAREMAGVQLSAALLNEERYDEVLDVCDSLLLRYPNHIILMRHRAEALIGRKRYGEAAAVLDSVHQHYRRESAETTGNMILLLNLRSQAFFGREQYREAADACTNLIRLRRARDMEKRFERHVAAAEERRKKALKRAR